jgi:hypothetical protein
MALRAGDRQGARRLFAEAQKLDPFHVSTYLRWIRSFLPPRLGAMLSGRTRA